MNQTNAEVEMRQAPPHQPNENGRLPRRRVQAVTTSQAQQQSTHHGHHATRLTHPHFDSQSTERPTSLQSVQQITWIPVRQITLRHQRALQDPAQQISKHRHWAIHRQLH